MDIIHYTYKRLTRADNFRPQRMILVKCIVHKNLKDLYHYN